MKLLLVINNEFSAFHLRGAVRHFAQKGWEVLIMSSAGKLVDELAAQEGGRVVEIPVRREITPFQDIKTLFAIIRALKKERPNIVNVGSPKTGFLFALVKLLRPSTPVLFTLRGIRSDTLSGLKRWMVFRLERWACQAADDVIVISPSLKEHAHSIGLLPRNKGVVLGAGSSNGVDSESFNPDKWQDAGMELRSRLGIKESDLVLGHVGRVTRDKGIEEVFHAYSNAKREWPNLHWIVAGPVEESDPVSPTVMKAIREDSQIHLLGQVDPVHPVYAAMDILVLFSYREGFGNVVLQAMSMKKPAVIADIPGLRDTIDQNCGVAVESKNVSLLEEAIRSYLDDSDKRKASGEAGRARVMEHFRQGVIWDGQESIYLKHAKGE